MVAVDGVGVWVVLFEGSGYAGTPGALGVAGIWWGELDLGEGDRNKWLEEFTYV